MNSSVFIFIFIFVAILISNRLSPKVYIQPYQRLFLLTLIILGSITALFPNQVAGPLMRLLQINRASDLIVYFIIIFILAVLNGIYKEIRDIKAKLIRIMQLSTIESFRNPKKNEEN